MATITTTTTTPIRTPIFTPRGAETPTETPPRLPRLWSIARRRWPVLVLLPLLALALAAVNYVLTPRMYSTTGQMTVTDQSPVPGDPQYAQYYRNLSSEAATDDLIRIVPGSRFAADVAAQLQTQGIYLTEEQVQRSLDTSRVFRVLTVGASARSEERALAICRAALDTLAARSADYFPNRPVKVLITNIPTKATSRSLQSLVLAVGTVLAAIVAAVVIALLMELVDTRLHDRRDVEELLGVPVVGAIPRAGPGKAA